MNIQKMKLLALAMSLAFGLAACDKYGSAENAGEKLDDAAEKASEKMDEAGKKMSEQAAETSAVLDDATITTKIKSAILAEPGINSLQISVETTGGEVTLSGTADSQENSDKAQQVASNISGVKQVKNQIVVKAPG
ncbi:Osmotically-inducible protein Y [Methylophilaceae bacterium]|nr:Osmotically-inducible protein Y [Methylophilaceae bacterium]